MTWRILSARDEFDSSRADKGSDTAVTVKMVATMAGVSRLTGGDILNNRGHLYNAETRERVLKTAQDMGYRPNSSAKV